MSTMLADPRTEQVLRNADEVDHVVCVECGWLPGMPALCGIREDGPEHMEDLCPWNCPHPTCPLCELEDQRHVGTWRHRMNTVRASWSEGWQRQ